MQLGRSPSRSFERIPFMASTRSNVLRAQRLAESGIYSCTRSKKKSGIKGARALRLKSKSIRVCIWCQTEMRSSLS